MSLTQSQFLLTQKMRRRSLEDTRTVDLIEGKTLPLVTIGWDSFSSFSPISIQMSPLVRHATGGKPVMGCLCCLGGSDMSHLPEEPITVQSRPTYHKCEKDIFLKYYRSLIQSLG